LLIDDCRLRLNEGVRVNADAFRTRTKAFAIGVVRLVESLPRSRTSDVIGRQLMRSGTSVGANYRAASRAKSRADFIAKMGIVEEECDESLYWMELLIESGQVTSSTVAALMREGNEILSMVVASRKTARLAAQSTISNRQSSIGR
jgi:four helix bundle protein